MLLDGETQFSNRQAVTVTAVSTNYMDMLANGTRAHATAPLSRDIYNSDAELLIQVTADFSGGTSIAVSLQTDDNPAFSSATNVVTTAAIPVATLKAGYRFPLTEFPVGTTERYVRLNYTVVGTMAAGTITAAVIA